MPTADPATPRERLIRFAADVIVSHPKMVIALNLLVAIALSVNVASIRFETAPDIWFLSDDPTLLAYHELTERFGSDRWLVIGFEAADEVDVITNDALTTVARITEALEEDPYIRRVRSLSNFETVRGVDGVLETEALIPEGALPLDPAALTEVRTTILAEPIALGLIVAPDLSAAAVVAEFEAEAEDLAITIDIVNGVYDLIAEEQIRSGFEIHAAGGPIMDWAFFTSSVDDNRRLVPALYGFIAVVLFVVLRHPLGVLHALLVIVLATGSTLGAFALAGMRFNNLTAMLPMILLAVSVANGVHVLVAFYGARRNGALPVEAARQSILDLASPCFLSSFTTAVGFASLTTSAMPPLRTYGAFAALGVMISFVVALTFLPALLSLGRAKEQTQRTPASEHEGGWIGAILAFMGATAARHPWPVTVLGIVVTVGALASATRIRVESDALEYFRANHIARHGTERVQDYLGGVANLEVLVRGATDDAIKDPQLLAELIELQRFFESVPEITKTLALTDFISRLNRSLNDEDPAFEVVPETREAVAQLLLLYGMSDPTEDLSDIVDYPYRSTRVTARMPFHSSERTSEIVAEVNGYLETAFENSPGVEDSLTGLNVLYNSMQAYVFETFVKSFCIALVIITVLIAISLRSVSLGLLSMVPNVLPITWILGLMGATGIPLNVGTALVASVTLGIAVDDTIHFLARYAEARRKGCDVSAATRHVFEHSGRAILTTSLILMGGFWTLAFAQFLPMVYLGLITGITIAFALLADLLLLPALLRLVGSRS